MSTMKTTIQIEEMSSSNQPTPDRKQNWLNETQRMVKKVNRNRKDL